MTTRIGIYILRKQKTSKTFYASGLLHQAEEPIPTAEAAVVQYVHFLSDLAPSAPAWVSIILMVRWS